MKLGCCTWNFMKEFPSSPEESISIISKLGFEGFELIVFSETELKERYSKKGIDKLNRYYQAYGLTLSEFVIDLGAIKKLADFNKFEKRKALRVFELGVKVGRDLGCEVINFVPHWPSGLSAPNKFLPSYIHPNFGDFKENYEICWHIDLPKNFRWIDVWENYIESIGMCVNLAEKNEILIALEGHPLTIFSNTDSFLRLFDEISSPNLGVNFDTAMLAAIHREYPPESIYKLMNRIFHVHARDTDGCLDYSLPAGRGILDWHSIINALSQISYKGFISIELGKYSEKSIEDTEYAKNYLKTIINMSKTQAMEIIHD